MKELIDLKLDAIRMLYQKLHKETNKDYYKYDEYKTKIETEIKQLEKEIIKLKAR